MPAWTWAALGVFLGLTIPAGVVATVATIRIFGRLRRLAEAIEPAAGQLTLGAERLTRNTEAAASSLARLEQSAAALRASRERLGVLLWALEDVRRLMRVARVLVPTK